MKKEREKKNKYVSIMMIGLLCCKTVKTLNFSIDLCAKFKKKKMENLVFSRTFFKIKMSYD